MTLSLSPAGEPCREFVNGAQDLVNRLTSSLRVLTHERERLKLVLETAAETNSISSRNGPSSGKAKVVLVLESVGCLVVLF